MRSVIEELRKRAGLDSDEAADRLLTRTLPVLRRLLTRTEAEWMTRVLADEHAQLLSGGADWESFGPEDLFRCVAEDQRVSLGVARETVELVCGAMADCMDDASVEHLQRHLPEYAYLFDPERTRLPAPHPFFYDPSQTGGAKAGESVSSRSIAFGRPGGTRPVSTSRPGSAKPVSTARPERAPTHSVARSADPHADTKLSSSRGLTQEREHESLATGPPEGKE